MTAIAFQPHSDDLVLFGCFTALLHNAYVVTVLRSVKQEQFGIAQATREQEDAEAFDVLGLPGFEQWPEPDTNPDWDAVESMMRALKEQHHPTVVIAPAWEEEGHEQHNRVGQYAAAVFGQDITYRYLTYRRGHGKSRYGTEVKPEAQWIALKHEALACYQSQIMEPSCRPWFMEDLNEFIL